MNPAGAYAASTEGRTPGRNGGGEPESFDTAPGVDPGKTQSFRFPTDADLDAVVQAMLWGAALPHRAEDRFGVLATAPRPNDLDDAGGSVAEQA